MKSWKDGYDAIIPPSRSHSAHGPSHVFNRQERVLGEGHPETLRSVNNLAVCLMSLGREADALEHSLQAAERLEQLPQPGGLWLDLVVDASTALARHARTSRLKTWEGPFAALSKTLLV